MQETKGIVCGIHTRKDRDREETGRRTVVYENSRTISLVRFTGKGVMRSILLPELAGTVHR